MLSTGNAGIEIDLRRSPTTLIVGENGAGKSTILDAICFALFNRGFRDVSKPQLLNSINQKNLEVTLDFQIGSKDYTIIRGHKPARFEIHCNDEQLNQEADSRDFQKYLEEHILKLNYKSFTQIVILGSASFTPFMQLPPSHRREIIEDLLDIRIFSTMNVILKEKSRELTDRLRQMDADIEVHKEKVRLQDEFIKSLKESADKRHADVELRIANTEDEIKLYEGNVQSLSERINKLKAMITDSEKIMGDKHQLYDFQHKLQDRAVKIQKDIEFYHDNDNCPTCQQNLNADLKTRAIHEHTSKALEIEAGLAKLDEQLQAVNARIIEIDGIQEDIIETNNEILTFNNQIIEIGRAHV